MRDRKPFYKIVRAGSLAVGQSIAYRLTESDIEGDLHLLESLRRHRPRWSRDKPLYRNCEVRQIIPFGSFLAIHLLFRMPEGRSRHYTTLRLPESWAGLYIGIFEATV